MKVLQVHVRYRQPGGEDVVVSAEADLLRGAGHQVVQHLRDNPAARVPSAAALAAAPFNPLGYESLRRAGLRHRSDVAHIHNTWYALSPAAFAGLRRAGVPTVLTLHNYRLTCSNALLFRDGAPCTDCVGASAWHGVRHRCYRGSAVASAAAAATIGLQRALGTWSRDVEVFLALTEFARRQFIAAGLPPERIRVKANSVPDPGPRTAAVSASSTVLFVGRLSAEKGADVLLDAWRRARPEGLELVVVGDGPERAALERDAPRGVRFLGRRPAAEVARLLLGARALAVPSRWYEGQPLTVSEAFAAGLPVLGTALGAVEEAVGALGERWLVRGDWAEALARLTDGDALDDAGRRARARYEQRYSPAASLAGLESAYAAAREG